MTVDQPQPVHDVFICHASEDKDEFVRPLAEALREHHIDVWYDEFVLNIGDSLRVAIDRGLSESRFGIVVLSASFFKKSWPQRELNGLVARETAEGRSLVLPIWHKVHREDVLRYSPPLADAVSISSDEGLSRVVQALLKRLRPEPSPLTIARDFLIEKGFQAPSLTDEWWLDLVGIKNSQLDMPEPHFSRWMFPLPFPKESSSRERGLNLAWTSLQLDWIHEADELKICQLTHPDEVHNFLRRWPGLMETGRNRPGTLAMYVPQITIPGYDAGFVDVFDRLLSPQSEDAYELGGYSGPTTIDGQKPVCGELISWRHPTFGNYADQELGKCFVNAYDHSYSRRLFDARECLVWLLCDASDWMPEPLRTKLIRGVTWYHSRPDDIFPWSSALSDALRGPPSKFRVSRRVRESIADLVVSALAELNVRENSDKIVERFIESPIVESYYAERRYTEEMRRRVGQRTQS